MSFWAVLTKVEVKALVQHFSLAEEGRKIREAEQRGDQIEADRMYRVARTVEHARLHPQGCQNALCGSCAERFDIMGREG